MLMTDKCISKMSYIYIYIYISIHFAVLLSVKNQRKSDTSYNMADLEEIMCSEVNQS
jgi:hypothetical protein